MLGGDTIALNIENSERIGQVKERIEEFTHATKHRLVYDDG